MLSGAPSWMSTLVPSNTNHGSATLSRVTALGRSDLGAVEIVR